MSHVSDFKFTGSGHNDALTHIESHTLQALCNTNYVDETVTDPVRRYYFFFERGSGHIHIDGCRFELGPGSIVVVPANSQFILSLENTAIGLMFSGSELFLRTRVAPVLNTTPSRYLDNYYKPSIYNRLNDATDRKLLKNRFKEAETARAKLGQGSDGAVMAYIFLLLGENISKNQFDHSRKSEKKRNRDSAVLYRFNQLIEQYFAQHLSIDKYSSLLNITRHRLIEICKQITAKTPLELVHKRLILEAKGELLSTDKSINQIAYELGYMDAAYFSRFFKKQTSNTPQDYRLLAPYLTGDCQFQGP